MKSTVSDRTSAQSGSPFGLRAPGERANGSGAKEDCVEHQLSLFIDEGVLFTVFYALEIVSLDYCSVLYIGLPLKST